MPQPAIPEDNLQDPGLETAMAGLTAAMADPSRIRILCALMDGRAWTATELSVVAEVAASTASAHLAKLLSRGLIGCVTQGRHRYYRLAGAEVASLLESIMGVAARQAATPVSRTPGRLRQMRTCYDHLAGSVAVAMYQSMLDAGWLVADGSRLTDSGLRQFTALGIATDHQTRRKPCCACLDWSERRFHLGGAAGAALLCACEQKGWITRVAGYREVTITPAGRRGLQRAFAIQIAG
ncbi:ArsR/SmtB family transcription factor [Shimwellia blattae]|uniref:Putative transcriptional regulator n=1 Tax=Shimwellia blattae (strain ATCC 29907 / DSM 4481 / JCM 1650 / NBRC 105725 / CDC 9005-74) TaxID=630626 RepID=I2BD77_SHIBC|nr:metalloregulator ArsR/SmtB family transcription factor [Shimwellia blattae]AFJ48481.1 putative transcriptional regulator [Shimwellia blattae DSM 4481 = NBRC 105725]GAB82556.1 putative ArsR family transcriptional regulator [Shimwellia blattae DSM 4481 = NBRC 105725]VDY65975.1 HTH-type transcriptional regulator CmtR [Shimwellia blattae]VEC26496.1 HTH-type transcriptional regulator CmtR [Shimwellia blattae]